MKKFFIIFLTAMICVGCGEIKPANADVLPTPDPIELKLSSLTLEEKIGQMVMIGVYGTELNDDIIYSLNNFHFGGVIFYDRNLESVAQAKKFTEDIEALGGQKVPMFFAIDEEGGRVARGKNFLEANVRRTFSTNVGGVLNTVLPAVEAFRRRGKGGQIVVTASIAGYGPLKSCPAYSATKACVKTWGLALRGMLRPEGIKVSVVCPGFVHSRITDRNTCPMPFFMEADKAARVILGRVDRNVGLVAFPWPMRLASWGLASLPFRINELVNRLLPAKVAAGKPKVL